MDTQEFISNVQLYFKEHGINLVIAFGVLIFGWVLLSLFAYILKSKFLHKLKLNYYFERIAFSLDVEKLFARIAFFVGLIFLFKTSAQLANFTEVDNFFDGILNLIGELAFLTVKALLPVLVAMVLAWVTRKTILFFGEKFKMDEKIGSRLDAGEAVSFSFTKSLSEMGYGVVFLLFIPTILSGLGLRESSEPIQKMIEGALTYLPKLFGAAVILIVGWFVAKIIREVITSFLHSSGLDSMLSKVNVQRMTGGIHFSKLGGTLVYAVILILVFTQALKKLEFEAFTDPVVGVLDQVFQSLPHLVFAGFLIFITYFLANIAKQIVSQVLEGLGFDNILKKLGFQESYTKNTPSQIVGIIAFYNLMFFAVIEALDQVGLQSVSEIIREIVVFAAQVIFGLVIFGIGLFVSQIVSKTIQSSSVPNAHFLSFLAKTGILILVGAMALKRMGLADEIVNIAFGLTLGALALGAGIAFGLGGKDEAANILKNIRSKFK